MHKSCRAFVLLLLIPCLAFGATNTIFTQEKGKLNLFFLDLDVSAGAKDKSGDATILISPDNKVLLLDSGHPESGKQVVAALKALGIQKIDYFVASHPHIDHIGGFSEVADNFEIGKVYRSALKYPSSTNATFLAAVKNKKIPVEILSEGDSFQFGDAISVKVFNPPARIIYPWNYPKNCTQFVNNNSLALKFTYGESSVWFSGDLYASRERKLVARYGNLLQSDVAKANHHGELTSNTLQWSKTIRATVVVAMHDIFASKAVYENYTRQGSDYHLTLNDGNVKVVLDNARHCQVTDEKDSWMN
ncbi:MBL fold metallo-hydrolase [uncultured Sphaerochaeta sp.]|uniref:ComEC/Rec2 family competence protein n=1 Tax=uncultured Sphaerochaeta sp. TaxID=886478 RepID=UPI002A0A0EA5|nr:MBL fold metallo-hydrolase [uncultured Sphaerochaeta sp.]